MEALDRIVNENELTPPNQLGADFTSEQERAVIRGLAVRATMRTQNMRKLLNELYGPSDVNPGNDSETVSDINPERKEANQDGSDSGDARESGEKTSLPTIRRNGRGFKNRGRMLHWVFCVLRLF